MDIMSISSERVLKQFLIIDKILSIQRDDSRKFCFRLSLSKTSRLFLATVCETELHEWLSVLLLVFQPPLTPAIANVYSVFLITTDNKQNIIPSHVVNLWICVELDELKFYQCHNLQFLLSIRISDLLSVDMVSDCHPADVDKIFKISFNLSENQK